MILEINWSEPIIQENIVTQIQPTDLNEFYTSADDFDKTNLFFVFLASFHHYLDKDEQAKAAHLSFLMAYYLFITLTPPGSWNLATHYINQAILLSPLDEYKEWLLLIEKGN